MDSRGLSAYSKYVNPQLAIAERSTSVTARGTTGPDR
jgi:hypothetical protein